jgi:amino acid transporter
MIIFALLLGFAILAAITYLALSKKSSFPVRVASIIALALMILAIIVSLFMIFGNPTSLVEESAVPIENSVPIQAEGGSSSLVLMLILIILLAFFTFIVISSFRENRKSEKKRKILK